MDTTPSTESTDSVPAEPVPSTTESKPKGKRSLPIIIAIVAGVLFLCCAAIVCIGAIYLLTRGSSSGSAKKPSHYGVYLKIGGKLVELNENEYYGVPYSNELKNLQVTSDKKPTILVWRSDTVLDYLQFFSIDDRNKLTYNATPREDGVIEIQPRSNLGKGFYCLIQGNPLAAGLPGWCFEVK